MRPRIIIIIVGPVIVVGIILYAVLFAMKGTNRTASNVGNSAVNNSASNATGGADIVPVTQAYPNAPTGAYLSLGTPQGTVQIKNIYLTSAGVGEDGVLILKSAPSYWFTYEPGTGSFWIAISGTPFSAWRTAAENDLLSILGVSESDACKLPVSEGTPYVQGGALNGKSFPLSFCSGAQVQ